MPNAFWSRYQRWSVYWYSTTKKKWLRKRFNEDFNNALKFFADNQHRKGITLHVDNHGYPPPTRITHHERITWKVVTRKGKKYKVKVKSIVNLMMEYNTKGIYWCPYCIKLRQFKFTEDDRGAEMFCPVCQLGTHDSTTRKHNPKAAVIEYSEPIKTRSTKRASRRR